MSGNDENNLPGTVKNQPIDPRNVNVEVNVRFEHEPASRKREVLNETVTIDENENIDPIQVFVEISDAEDCVIQPIQNEIIDLCDDEPTEIIDLCGNGRAAKKRTARRRKKDRNRVKQIRKPGKTKKSRITRFRATQAEYVQTREYRLRQVQIESERYMDAIQTLNYIQMNRQLTEEEFFTLQRVTNDLNAAKELARDAECRVLRADKKILKSRLYGERNRMAGERKYFQRLYEVERLKATQEIGQLKEQLHTNTPINGIKQELINNANQPINLTERRVPAQATGKCSVIVKIEIKDE